MVVTRLQCYIWGILSIGATTAWIPPCPDSKAEWESVHDMRRRLGQPYNYTTHTIAPEMCRYISEEDCEEVDASMKEHVEAHKALQKSLWRARANPNLGKIKVLVIMIRFTDHVGRELIPKSGVENFWNTKFTDWLAVNSQGRYSIDPVVVDWQTTDNTEEYYSFGMRGIVPELQQMAWPILDSLDSRPGWDWSEYDQDGNGDLDSVVMIHSGYGAETTTTDCFGAEYQNRIWAHAYSRSKNSWKSKDGSIKLNGYTVSSAFDADCGTEPGKLGLTAHEYMHTLGLEDLYDGVDPLEASGIGAFDIMAYPYGQTDDADNPGHLSAWSKVLAEWLEPKVIDSSGEFTLKASEISDESYMITLADYGVVSEYLLIENRQPLEFDINIWAAGLVIYHIDDAANLQTSLGYPGQEGWPENGNHYQVALLPKDGNYGLEKGTNSGDAGDMWQPGDILGPGEGGTVYPNTDLYQGGFIQESRLWLQVLSQSGTDITFRVGGFNDEPLPEGVSPTGAPTGSPTKIPTSAPTGNPTTTPTGSPTPLTQNPTTVAQSPTQRPTAQTLAPTIQTTTSSPTQVQTTSGPAQIAFELTQTPTVQNDTASPISVPSVQRPSIPTIPTVPTIPAAPTVPTVPTIPSVPSISYLEKFDPFEDSDITSPSYLSPFDSSQALRAQPAEDKGFISMAIDALTHRAGAWLHGGHSQDSTDYMQKKEPNASANRASDQDLRKPTSIVFEASPGRSSSSTGLRRTCTLYAASTACVLVIAFGIL